MPELRSDWLLGRSVLVAENRAQRPNEFGERFASAAEGARATLPPASGWLRASTCPFCRGQEHQTPPAVFELADEHGQWRTRVVPNMFPAVVPQESYAGFVKPFSSDSTKTPVEVTTQMTAAGVHEVIIEVAHHVDRMSSLSEGEMRCVLETFAQRLRHWRRSGRFAYGLIFKNQGMRAGASLAHVHSQLIALPQLPPIVAAEYERANTAYHEHRACTYCRLIHQERESAERIITDSDQFVVFCPFASVQPFEAWLLPAQHAAYFEDLQSDNLDRLASVLSDLIRRIETVVPESAYNMLLRTGPWLGGGHDSCHWRIEILPRVSALAGFELASGMFINSLAPERAASKLRSI